MVNEAELLRELSALVAENRVMIQELHAADQRETLLLVLLALYLPVVLAGMMAWGWYQDRRAEWREAAQRVGRPLVAAEAVAAPSRRRIG